MQGPTATLWFRMSAGTARRVNPGSLPVAATETSFGGAWPKIYYNNNLLLWFWQCDISSRLGSERYSVIDTFTLILYSTSRRLVC